HSGELAVEQLRAVLVQPGERLVEDQELRLVQERPAEREALQLPAGERRRPLSPSLPEAEALEQHPDPLAPLGDAVEPPVEVEVLERGQLAVDERLVPEESDRSPVGLDLERAGGRQRKPGAHPQQRRLAGAVRPGHDEEASARQVEVQPPQHALVAVAPLHPARTDHSESPSTNRKNATEMTPFIVKNAVSSRRRSPGRTSECS